MDRLPFKQFTAVEPSADGMSVIFTMQIDDGQEFSFDLPYTNADWLATALLKLSPTAVARQQSAGLIATVANDGESLEADGYRVLTKPGDPRAMVQFHGAWASSRISGATSLRVDRRQAEGLAAELLEAAQILPQMTRPQ